MCIFVLKLYAMKRLFILFTILLLHPLFGLAQNSGSQNYKRSHAACLWLDGIGEGWQKLFP